ncbi:MAG TPA: hypothetical protein EYO40_07245 [Phycisphaerales bacterium]|nr:hypothetical protein [Phycisphaerales bacterium]
MDMKLLNKNVTVMGLGRFGGGLGVTRWLLDQGARVLLTDLANEDELTKQIKELGTHTNLQVVFGKHRMEDFVGADVVIANPAIPMPWKNVFLCAAWEANIQVTTEIEMLVEQLHREQVIGVTGTSGKSTTASMLYDGLKNAGITCHLGGNIGGSLLNSLSEINENDVVVLELSSAMLWWLNKNTSWSPSTAVLTNIEPNHVDWHGSFEEYKSCKELLFANQAEGDIAITQDQNASFTGLIVPGKHNQKNAAVAFLAGVAIGADPTLLREGIQRFRGLPHRLQLVCDGYYNDSKSTTPKATELAVDAFADAKKIHLIVGGYDKKIDLTLLAAQASRVACMYAIGETANTIVELASGNIKQFKNLEQAVAEATKNMNSEDVLLLSPGCASWDQFVHFEARGELFCSLVNESKAHQQVH